MAQELAKVSAKERYSMRQFMRELAKHRGRHTELVSVYVPAGYDMNNIISHLQQEAGTATNIKSTSTRKNVVDALEKMIVHLRGVGRTPANGLAVFSGNVAEREGQSDVQVWSLEPPIPLNLRLYRCDKQFILEPIEDIIMDKTIYGLVVFDSRDATIALLKGKAIQVLKTTHSEVPGKMRAGGQSAVRFARNRELAQRAHFKKIAEYMKNEFLNLEGLKGIILGGPGTTVNQFMQREYVTGDVQKKIIGTRDLSYTDEFGLNELVDKIQDLLSEEELMDEKKVMQRFFTDLSKDTGLVAYGKDNVMSALKMGAVEKVLLSEALDDEIVNEFEKEAEAVGTEVIIISTESREGAQLRDMGKIVSILRYNMNH